MLAALYTRIVSDQASAGLSHTRALPGPRTDPFLPTPSPPARAWRGPLAVPFHLNLSSSFLNGANERAGMFSTLISTFYAGAPLAYPFIPDFYVAVLVAGGLDWHGALSATGGVLLSSLTALAYLLNYRVGGSTRAAALSLFIAVCTGGLGGFYYAAATEDWWTPSSLTSQTFIHGPDHVLYWIGGRSAFWFGMCAHILFPQRTVQHAYPLALAALLVIWTGLTRERKAMEAPALTTPAGAAAAAAAAPVLDDKEKSQSSSSSSGMDAAGGESGAGGAGKARRRVGPSGRTPQQDGESAAATDAEDVRKPSDSEPASAHSRGMQLRVYALAGLVTGLLPLMQPHSFVCVGVIVLVLAAFNMLERVIGAIMPQRAAAPGGVTQSLGFKWLPVGDGILEWATFGIVAFSTVGRVRRRRRRDV